LEDIIFGMLLKPEGKGAARKGQISASEPG
jgi:hypothetical protein